MPDPSERDLGPHFRPWAQEPPIARQIVHMRHNNVHVLDKLLVRTCHLRLRGQLLIPLITTDKTLFPPFVLVGEKDALVVDSTPLCAPVCHNLNMSRSFTSLRSCVRYV